MNLDGLIVLAQSYIAQQKSQAQQDERTKFNCEYGELILSQLLIVRNGGKFRDDLWRVLSDGFDTKTDLANELMAFMVANPQLEG
jgi:hypothetical protein